MAQPVAEAKSWPEMGLARLVHLNCDRLIAMS
jgi:hypothetical protein